MIDENVLIAAIYEQQAEDDKAYELMYFADNCREIYRAKKAARDKIIETIEKMSEGSTNKQKSKRNNGDAKSKSIFGLGTR